MTRRSAVAVVVGAVVWMALFLALALQHFVLSWPVFPWWYNIGVVVPAFPAVLLGARIAKVVTAPAPIASLLE